MFTIKFKPETMVQIRKERNLSRAEVVRILWDQFAIRCSTELLRHWENGEVPQKLLVVNALADLLGLKVSDLFEKVPRETAASEK